MMQHYLLLADSTITVFDCQLRAQCKVPSIYWPICIRPVSFLAKNDQTHFHWMLHNMGVFLALICSRGFLVMGFLMSVKKASWEIKQSKAPSNRSQCEFLQHKGGNLYFLLFISVAVGMVYLCSSFSQGLSKGQQCGRTLWGSCAMAPKSRSKSLARAETQKKALKKAVRSHRDNWDWDNWAKCYVSGCPEATTPAVTADKKQADLSFLQEARCFTAKVPFWLRCSNCHWFWHVSQFNTELFVGKLVLFKSTVCLVALFDL